MRTYAYGDTGEPVGLVLIWIKQGKLHLLEYATYVDNNPTELPDVGNVAIE